MARSDAHRLKPSLLSQLERRQLLAAPQVLGNTGQVISSQFQPFGFKTAVGTQFRNVEVRGPVSINLINPDASTTQTNSTSEPSPNSGIVNHSQFNGGGFLTVGLQFGHDYFGRGLTVSGTDTEAASTSAPSGSVGTSALIGNLPTSGNANLILNSQYNDGGFGILERNTNGTVTSREGRVGLQWRNTRVRGAVKIGLDDSLVQPGGPAAVSTVMTPTPTPTSGVTGKVINLLTNSGKIRGSQFNDGGFGDIGLQWSSVAVNGHVGTSTNTLFINPQQNNTGAISVTNRVFGQTIMNSATPLNDLAQSSATSVAQSLSPATPAVTNYTNSATNSGQLIGAQFNDGGFGDIGLQWKGVTVGGSVTAVHNSLTIQPQNTGQGLITVANLSFPATPAPAARPDRQKLRVLPASPAVVTEDGNSLAGKLSAATGPLDPFFHVPFPSQGTISLISSGNYPLVNAATNSGAVLGGQFNAGGFGDIGLQWQKVHVGGNVRVVHNSLAVQPQGSQLAGINVSNISYGPAVSARLAKHLSVLPYTVITSNTIAPNAPTTKGKNKGTLIPPNSRWLTNQQLASANGTDLFLQWNGIEHSRGLVLIHNVILIQGVGPLTGPITLSDIRFPFRVPKLKPVVVPVASSTTSNSDATPAVSTNDVSATKLLLNAANNSGLLSHAQFSDGGFGNIGFQWRNVSVAGSVSVVHNVLSVDESADRPAGDVPGPIDISNVTFNSGALNGALSTKRNQVVVAPPNRVERKSTHKINPGHPLLQDSSVTDETANSGIVAGGQLADGGSRHIMLQWQCTKVGGRVTVEDNILSISVLDLPAGPITISNVTFA
jgi:hypothetical protein